MIDRTIRYANAARELSFIAALVVSASFAQSVMAQATARRRQANWPAGTGDSFTQSRTFDAKGVVVPELSPSADGESSERIARTQTIGPARLIASPASEPQGSPPALTSRFISCAVPPEGDTLTELSFSPDGNRIIAAHRDSQNLIVFDAASRTVTGVIPVSGSPNSLAVSSDGIHAVTANLFEDTVSIVDLAAGLELAAVPVGAQPGVVRITPDGTKAIVGNTADGSLSVVDILNQTELRRLSPVSFVQVTSFNSWAVTYRFSDFVITPDSATVVFPEYFNNRLQFFDVDTGAVASVLTEPQPFSIALSPDGTTAVVAHDSTGLVSVVDVPNRQVTKSILTGTSAWGPPIAINPSKTKAVVGVPNNVRLVNLATGAVSGDLSVLGSAQHVLTTADGLYCIVGNYVGSLVSYASESVVSNTLNTTYAEALAVSPVNPRAAAGHAVFKETMEVIDVNGPSAHLEGTVPTGPPPEADKAARVAVTGDGALAVVLNVYSNNASILDLGSDTIQHVVPVGQRPKAVAVTPDGRTAVVANSDSVFANVIDLQTGAATEVTISRRASQVAISPDGQYAYLSVVASGDGVWRINLNTLQVEGSRIYTGNMGGIGYAFDQASGIALSHDGSTLVTCNSFDDNISIIDTTAWTEEARVPVGTFPVQAVFSPDDKRIYVSNKNADTVSVVANSGSSSSLLVTVPVGDVPWQMVASPDGNRLYVTNYSSVSVSVVDTVTNAVFKTIALPRPGGFGAPIAMTASGDGRRLFIAADGADFHVIDTAVPDVVATINTGLAPADLAFNGTTRSAVVPSPRGGDGISIITLPEPAVVGRYVFYNASWYDGNNAAIDTSPNTGADNDDDDAIDPTKQPLMPGGGQATFANWTGFNQGINGLIYDVAWNTRLPQISDFIFHDIGKLGTEEPGPDNMITVLPSDFLVRAGQGPGGADRVVIVFPSTAGNNASGTVQNTWLQVDIDEGLAAAETHFWGNASGDSGNDPPLNILVHPADEINARLNPTTPLNRALVDNPYDYNKDSLVNPIDQIYARLHFTTPLNCVKMITR